MVPEEEMVRRKKKWNDSAQEGAREGERPGSKLGKIWRRISGAANGER